MENLEPDPYKEFEFPNPTTEQARKSKLLKNLLKRSNKMFQKIGPVSAVLALVLSAGGIYFGYPVYKNHNYTDPANDGYVAPRSPGDVVDVVLKGTVVVNCIPNKGESSYGSGWSIDLKPSSKVYKSSIITNHHVIEDCLGGKGVVNIEDYDGKTYESVVDVYDEKEDLAKISTKLKVPALQLSDNAPWPGYWVMTAGTADGYQGSVSFGSVMNFDSDEIFITANISHGNSGGPLVDNEGFVIGTNSWGRVGEQYNGAMSLDAMCAKILKCKYAKGKEFWEYK